MIPNIAAGLHARDVRMRFLNAVRSRPTGPVRGIAAWASLAALVAATLLPAPQAAEAAMRRDWRELAHDVGMRLCRSGMDRPPFADAVPGERVRFRTPQARSSRVSWTTDIFTIEATVSDGPQRLNFIAFFGGPEKKSPLFRIVFGERCDVRGAEMIEYQDGPGSKPKFLHLFGRDLRPRARPIPYNPPLPAAGGGSGDCVEVAILDNGVNYLLPAIDARLARTSAGELVGYDFWEKDALPFDFGVPPDIADPRMSPFESPQHGTSVASILLADAPANVCLAPYRYFPLDPEEQIGEIVDRIAADGARVVVLATGRDKPWPAFRDAMRRHPKLLFVAAAGNDGFDLAERPLYPMAYDEPNLLVVAASEADGSLWPRSNTGRGVVDVAVPAVDVAGFDFNGRQVRLTGTSFASPRIGALAGLLAARRPQWDGAALAKAVGELAAARAEPEGDVPAFGEAQFRALLADPGL